MEGNSQSQHWFDQCFLCSSAPDSFQLLQDDLIHWEGVEGSRLWATHTCQAQKHWHKSKPQDHPQSKRLFPSCPICWPTREEDKSTFGLPTKVHERLSPHRQSWGATRPTTGVQEELGREGENPRRDSPPLMPGSPWSERGLLHGFFLPLRTSAELHLRQLDVPNHIGVCEERKHSSGLPSKDYGGDFREGGKSWA